MIKESNEKNTNPFGKKIEYIENEKAIAVLDYSLIYDRIEIDNIIVNEEYRNKKIGTKLLEYIIKLSEEQGLSNITLEVRKSNAIARHLYEKMGFKEVAIRKYYYGDEDAILMEKKVI